MVKEKRGEHRYLSWQSTQQEVAGVGLTEASLAGDIQDLSSCADSAPYYPCDLGKITHPQILKGLHLRDRPVQYFSVNLLAFREAQRWR